MSVAKPHHHSGFDAWAQQQLADVEDALQRWVPADAPAGLGLAMRYGVQDGGKRLRPLLVLAACDAVAGDRAAALRAAVAVELIHGYSLVHDDMPCMDNDVLRRGKPTVHVQFGQAQAMLAGDAMQALAFEVLTPEVSPSSPSSPSRTGMRIGDSTPPALQARLCGLLARAAGHAGMAGGQAIDLASVGLALNETTLRDMHRRKTGALLQASVLMGAACGATSAGQWQALSDYGAALGLAFQVVDDVLDVTQASDTLGKTAGKDQDQNKPTYVNVLGLSAAMQYAQTLRAEAHRALAASGLAQRSAGAGSFPDPGNGAMPVGLEWLATLADKVVERDN